MSFTGRRWRRPPRVCPEWCAKDHQCTARHGYPSGQHRSDPLTWSTPYGTFVATRVQTIGRTARLELRVVANLDGDDHVARIQAQLLAVRVDETVRDVLIELTLPEHLAEPQLGQHVRRPLGGR